MMRFVSEYHTKMWIDGHCFEVRKFQKRSKLIKEDKVDNLVDLSSIPIEKYQISTNEAGKFLTKFHLPFPYYGKLQKFPYLDVKNLENNTKTSILIPNISNQPLTISGESRENIIDARNELHSIISEIRDQYRALQFISIPTTSEKIVENFTKFKETILNGDKINGMEESIFINPKKLHLTIAVFTLLDDNEKREAVNALNDYKSTILEPLIKTNGPIQIKICGLDCMNANLKKVDVLYANAKIENETDELNLQKIANDISNHFYHRGLICRYQDNVKLHMTLINTKYRKLTNNPKRKRWIKKQSFDATTIVEKYKDYNFGTCQLNSIHLSIMSTIGEDENPDFIMEFEIKTNDKCTNYNYDVKQVPVFDRNLSYEDFYNNYLLNNHPCIIGNITQNWESFKFWLVDNQINFNYLTNKYGNSNVTVYDCNEQYYNSHKTEIVKFMQYLNNWRNKDCRLKYLKDWHLKNQSKNDNFYQVPIYFASDWLNEYLVGTDQDDYRFVYMGPKGTWTPFHADVFSSYSWSVNVCGKKRWLLFSPEQENSFRDNLNNLPFDISKIYQNADRYVIQNAGEAIFVPSGWYHQVWNLEDTISINHNWINGCNLEYVWKMLDANLDSVKKEIDDCREMKDFKNHCQIMLKASYGIDFHQFFDFLEFIAKRRLAILTGEMSNILFHGHKLGRNHAIFDLKSIDRVLRKFLQHEDCVEMFDNLTKLHKEIQHYLLHIQPFTNQQDKVGTNKLC